MRFRCLLSLLLLVAVLWGCQAEPPAPTQIHKVTEPATNATAVPTETAVPPTEDTQMPHSVTGDPGNGPLQILVYRGLGDTKQLQTRITFTYDEAGSLTGMTEETLDPGGNVISLGAVSIQMDGRGYLLRRSTTGESDRYMEDTAYFFEDGRLVAASTLGSVQYTYDAEGKLIGKTEASLDHGYRYSHEYRYEEGRLVAIVTTEEYTGTDPILRHTAITTDDQGRIIRAESDRKVLLYDRRFPFFYLSHQDGDDCYSLYFADPLDHTIVSLFIDAPKLSWDAIGRLQRLEGTVQGVPCLIEIHYAPTAPTVCPYDQEQIAQMLYDRYQPTNTGGRVLVIPQSVSDGTMTFSLRFDPDDPQECPEGQSIPLATLTVDTATGELFQDFSSVGFLWE